MAAAEAEIVKENVRVRALVPLWVVWLAVLATGMALLLAAGLDARLPPVRSRSAPPNTFIAEIAYEHLLNLTALGPRVAGSYENEVAAVALLTAALRRMAAAASPHNTLDVELHTASGEFSLAFFDGMNHVYRDVQSVVARARALGASGAARTALLINCHYDTVPDSPGASDDAAGCAVALETLRALLAGPRPLAQPVLLLLNGAEESIMQASHAFITQHKWARSVRAFINIEACGAGGREVLFQAGPHDPWIMTVYARSVPHPFASSLAQELFESGLVPADTDFRVFRDFGNLSGVDLAWSSNGYVYHTHLDTAAQVSPAVLQRTGDNVLALATGMLESGELERPVDVSGAPVFFDVLGCVLLVLAPARALLVAGLALLLVLLRLAASAAQARRQLGVRRRAWWAAAGRALGRQLAGAAAGLGAAAALALLLPPLSCYGRAALLLPLYGAAPAAAALQLLAAPGDGGLPVSGGRTRWWAARAVADGAALGWAGVVLLAVLLRLRSGYVPLLWALGPTLADLAASAAAATGGARAWAWAAGAVLPVLQTSYLALGSLATLVPVMGRAGQPPLKIDVLIALVTSLLTLITCSWLAPLLRVCPSTRSLRAACVLCAVCGVLLAALGPAYSARRPQRLMVLHVRRTDHTAPGQPPAHYYWLPQLDDNTPATLDALPGWGPRSPAGSQCDRWVYCGAPYFLPVLALVPRAHWLPAPHGPPAAARVHARLQLSGGPRLYHLNITIVGPSHVVALVSPASGGAVLWPALRPARAWPAPGGPRRTYFVSLTAARRPRARPRHLHLAIQMPETHKPGDEVVQVSIGGHGMSVARDEDHQRRLAHLPPHIAPTGWPVDLHLYQL